MEKLLFVSRIKVFPYFFFNFPAEPEKFFDGMVWYGKVFCIFSVGCGV